MMKHLLIPFIFCLLAQSIHALPQEDIRFVHIGLDDGLSQSTIFDITQDRQGNMWFATYNGLNKYNGYQFTVYQHDEANPHSINSDIIRTCHTDHHGQVWIGTDEGLSLYDAEKERFENHSSNIGGRSRPVNGIAEVGANELWIFSLKDCILRFDTQTRQFKTDLPHPLLRTLRPTTLYSEGDDLYIGSGQKVFCYSLGRQQIDSIALPGLQEDRNITSILRQSSTRVWIGTEGNGLYRYNPQTGEMAHYTHSPRQKESLSSDYVRSLALDSEQRLWVGTIQSLNIYQEKEDHFHCYASDPLESNSLSQPSVRNIYRDTQGGMWLGTYYGGINYWHPLKNRFHNLRHAAKTNSLNSNIINFIQEDAQGDLWIGTNGGGLNRYCPPKRQFSHYTIREGLGSNDVKAIYIDEEHDLVYIGTHTGGLSILHRKRGHLESYNRNSREKNIYAIEPTEDGCFWMSGMSSIIRFNPQEKSFATISTQADGNPFLHDRVTAFYRDRKQRLWLISEKGLYAYREKQGKLQQVAIPALESISRLYIQCLYEATDDKLWIGTRSGLYRFDEEKGELTRYTTAQGLPNQVVQGILEDSTGKLWVSTDRGLCSLHPQTGTFRTYTSDDGLQSNQFSAACKRTRDGQMYFGGINGITTFRPEILVDNPYTPPVTITRLRLFNQPVHPNDDFGLLTTSIDHTRRLTLTAQQSMFSLEFVVPNYIAGTHNTFAYRLKGYDKRWYTTQSQHVVSYSNLPHGTYRFQVKAANNDGKWNEQPTELEIVVLPVWYKTWWAYLLFTATFAGAILFVVRYFWVRKSMQSAIELERRDKARQTEMNEMKVRFFINISHELRTPLTLILAPLQEMLQKASDRWQRKQLELMERNANRLLYLVNQLLDFRRAELGVFHLQVSPTPVHQIIEKNYRFYEPLAQRKKIDYDFSSEMKDETIYCDGNYIELMVNNLLSNAFKYTGEGQNIQLVLRHDSSNLLLQVKDTGCGIPKEKQGRIFERFYQADGSHQGSGIGLSLVHRLVELHHGRIELESEVGKGSTFSIYLPNHPDAYASHELLDSNPTEKKEPLYSTNPQELYAIDTEPLQEEITDGTADAANKATILIVEDNNDIRQYLSEALEEKYRILKATQGEEALTLLKEHEVDLVLTDVMMPVMDGLQLCKQIKQNLHTSHIPVIILSAKSDLKEQLEGLNLGADDYIPKPFSIALVTTKIKNIFRTRYSAIQHYAHSLEIEPEKIAVNPLDEECLKRAVDIVERHIDDVEFSTDDFAREMCMSRSSLHVKMKALTGESSKEFIRKIRFNKACKLLKEGRYNVAEISVMVGYNTPAYFASSFKKFFGCLPSEYAKNERNTVDEGES